MGAKHYPHLQCRGDFSRTVPPWMSCDPKKPAPGALVGVEAGSGKACLFEEGPWRTSPETLSTAFKTARFLGLFRPLAACGAGKEIGSHGKRIDGGFGVTAVAGPENQGRKQSGETPDPFASESPDGLRTIGAP